MLGSVRGLTTTQPSGQRPSVVLGPFRLLSVDYCQGRPASRHRPQIVESSRVDRRQDPGRRLKIRVDRVIYTTITLLSLLIIYDGWEQLRFWNVVAVIVGPILAIFLGGGPVPR